MIVMIPIGVLVKQGYFWSQTLYRLTRGEINPLYALCRN